MLIAAIILLTVSYQSIFAKTDVAKSPCTQWSITIANSEMKHNPELWQADFVKKPKWDYTQGLVAFSMLRLFEQTGDSAYFKYVNEFANYFVQTDGSILTYKQSDYSLDRVNGGKFLWEMYRITKDEKYMKAVKMLYSQFETHPRTKVGVFWHKKIYPNQVWLDGLYMGAPFYAECAKVFNDSQSKFAFDDAAKQMVVGDSVTFDPKTGLNYHAWDESRSERWCDPNTGLSKHFWGRSLGWYMMAMVDILDYLPKNHPQRKQIIANLNRLSEALVKYQDEKTGMWYQIIDMPTRKGNYIESSCSAMFTYAIAKGVNQKYLPKKFNAVACKAFTGLIENAMQKNEDGTTSITRACSVAGLGGNPYRDGTFEYYISEPIRNDDPKVIGPFILAGMEMAKMGCK